MAKFVVTNRSTYNIELVLPAPYESRRSAACFILTASNSIDILPWVGSIQSCRAIAQLRDLEMRNIIDIEEDNGE